MTLNCELAASTGNPIARSQSASGPLSSAVSLLNGCRVDLILSFRFFRLEKEGG
jgi:hypothetical protein